MPEPQSLPTLTAYFYGSFGVEGFLVQGLGSGHNQRSSHVAESQTETPKIRKPTSSLPGHYPTCALNPCP